MSTGKAIQFMKARLERVVQNSDQIHTLLFDSKDVAKQEINVLEELPFYLKLHLTDQQPPVSLRFVAAEKNQVYELYYSTSAKEPEKT